jgi:hypothetical protein
MGYAPPILSLNRPPSPSTLPLSIANPYYRNMPSTRQTRRTLGHLAGLSIACLYLYAGQAHFTSRLTPEFAENINAMTANSHRAFWFLGMDFDQVGRPSLESAWSCLSLQSAITYSEFSLCWYRPF